MTSHNEHRHLRPTIVIFVDGYLPGHKLGGPIRSVSGLVERLGDDFDFRIFTRDRDMGDKLPYGEVSVNRWQRVGKASVYYASPAALALAPLRSVIADCSYDLLYCNSLFSPRMTLQVLLLRRAGAISQSAVVVAPRGELAGGALAIKRQKKSAFLRLARAIGLYRHVIWHASTEYERGDILAHFGAELTRAPQIVVAPMLSALEVVDQPSAQHTPKKAGSLRAVFLSRIARNKNLHGALAMLARVAGQVEFTIYGPMEDRAYWSECQAIVATLPSNVRVIYGGVVAHAHVMSTIAKHDLFVLLSHGENFGHVIIEALSAGCPVLISDRTAWRGLEEVGVGWDIALSDEQRIVDVLGYCVRMDAATHWRMSRAAMSLAHATINSPDVLEQNRQLFRVALRDTNVGA